MVGNPENPVFKDTPFLCVPTIFAPALPFPLPTLLPTEMLIVLSVLQANQNRVSTQPTPSCGRVVKKF